MITTILLIVEQMIKRFEDGVTTKNITHLLERVPSAHIVGEDRRTLKSGLELSHLLLQPLDLG